MPLRTPEQLAIDHIAGHAEHAVGLGCGHDLVVFLASLAVQVVEKSCGIKADLGQHPADEFRVLNIEFAPPEAFIHRVMIGPEVAPVFGVQHADVGDRTVEDFLWAANHQARVGWPRADSPYSCT